MSWLRAIALALAWIATTALARSTLEAGSVDPATASRFADEVVRQVETTALRPKDEAAYRRARDALLDATGAAKAAEAPMPRALLYDATRAVLATLDTDGHTLLWSREQLDEYAASAPSPAAADVDVVRIVETRSGRVAVITPPSARSLDETAERTYAAALLTRVADGLAANPPCALVVDLSRQTGGVAWTPLAVLGTLLSDRNSARLVDRDGRRTPLVPHRTIEGNRQRLLSSSADPLIRFHDEPLAIVIDHATASAGEMLAIALMGEPRVTAFGEPSAGATTANVPIALPDRATLLVTRYRYALGDAAPIRGPVVPDHGAPGESPTAVVESAADWVAERSSLCRAGRAPRALQ